MSKSTKHRVSRSVFGNSVLPDGFDENGFTECTVRGKKVLIHEHVEVLCKECEGKCEVPTEEWTRWMSENPSNWPELAKQGRAPDVSPLKTCNHCGGYGPRTTPFGYVILGLIERHFDPLIERTKPED